MARRLLGTALGMLVLLLILTATPILADTLVNMEFKEAPLVDVFQILGEIGGWNVLVDPSVKGNVSFVLKDLSVEEALELVTRTTGYRYKVVGNTLVVATEERLRTEFSSEEFVFIALNHVDVNSARGLLSMVLPRVRIYADDTRQLMVVYGSPAELEMAQKVIREYDHPGMAVKTVAEEAPPAKEEIPLKSEAVPVIYGDGAAIIRSLAVAFPSRTFHWDAQTRRIIGQALEEEWEIIRSLIWQLDLPNFQLKGVMQAGERSLALVEYGGSTVLLGEGDALEGWTLTDIQNRSVKFYQDGREFTAVMGR
ncbi:MAG: secretin and TonB N-terminal domain-containing protein [Limnochordia bacterium]|jgi:type II secretory pathway component GspD/PulD (secretin)